MPVPPRWRRRLRSWIRRSPVMWWLGAGALALVTLVVVRSSLAQGASLAERYGELRLVAVVDAPVAAGSVVERGDVRMERRPASTLPRGVPVGGPSGAAGHTALVPLVPGEVLLRSRLAPAGLTGAAALLPAGMRAVAVPAGPGGSPPVAIGDHVDVLATFSDGTGGSSVSGDSPASSGPPTVVVAANARVLALDDEADSVTVAVPPADLPALAYAITAGVITLALTGP